MDDQHYNQRPVPQFRHIISSTLERVGFGFRARRDRDYHSRVSPSHPPLSVSLPETVTCTHIAHSWFSEAVVPTDESDRMRDVENARATLGELLAESVIFGTINAFYPPQPTLSQEKQSVIRRQLLSAFELSTQRKSGSPFRRAPQARLPLERTFHRFPDLPAEIRLQIWEASLPGRGYRTLHIGQMVGEPYCWTAKLPMPTLSRVCRESREVVLKRNIFPIYGCAPYRSGPGSSHDVTRRFITSWASCDDCLDFGSDCRPAALRCGDYLERIGDFAVPAHSLTSILLPAGIDNETRGNNQLGDIWGGAKQLMVVIQVIYISLPILPPSEISDHSRQWYHDGQPILNDDGISVCKVGGLVEGPPLDPLLYRASVHRRPKNHHITTVASVYDKPRIKELLALGTVTRHWTNRASRLRALHYHSNAFCMDCLVEWWEKYARTAAEAALMGQRHGALDLDGDGLENREFNVFPQLIPAIRFKLQWPDLEDHL